VVPPRSYRAAAGEPAAALAAAISQATGRAFPAARASRLAGGSISGALLLEASDGQRAFVKLNAAAFADAFAAEEDGLRLLAADCGLAVPRPLCRGVLGERAFLALEWLELAPWSAASATVLGHGLAALHRRTGPRFGWQRDNWIGATPQPNAWSDDWSAFQRAHRLGFQLELARRRGFARELERAGSERLLEQIPALLAGHRPQPSLVHGDLWSGNASALADGRAALFDPATHYGDREVDIAMSELFGGFPAAFYAAYRDAWPLEPGYELRRELYNLYHLLNHLNLFGAGYLERARATIARLLAALR